MHADVDRLGVQWPTGGHLGDEQAARLAELLKGLPLMYAQHIDIEDNQVFPALKRLLRDAEADRRWERDGWPAGKPRIDNRLLTRAVPLARAAPREHPIRIYWTQ